MQVVPASSRHTLIDSGQSLIFSIPSRRQWATVIFIGIWSIGWLFGEVTAIGSLLSGKTNGVDLFILVWLSLWTVGGLTAIYQVLWQLAGKEILVATPASITLTRQIFNTGFPKIYDAEHIKDLRATPPGNRNRWLRSTWSNSEGSIAFDYGAKTIRFANGVDEAEGKQIIGIIHRRFTNIG